MAGPQQAWVIPPQATTTELSSFGLRTVDVIACYEAQLESEPSLEGRLVLEFECQAGRCGRARVIEDDRAQWLRILPVAFAVDARDPRIEVTVEEVCRRKSGPGDGSRLSSPARVEADGDSG